jgi:hypothetical protein
MDLAEQQIFLSYSHLDAHLKDGFVKQFRVIDHHQRIDLWDDGRIKIGEDWYAAITQSLSHAQAAVLLISSDFLLSEFIINEEVSTFLRRRAEEGMPIFPILVRPCAWTKVDWLKRLQIRAGDCALSLLSPAEQELKLCEIAQEIHKHMFERNRSVVATDTVNICDLETEVYPSKDNEDPISIVKGAIAPQRASIAFCTQRLLDAQSPEHGGFRAWVNDRTSRPQVWSSAQAMLAILQATGSQHAIALRQAWSYIESQWQDAEQFGWTYFGTSDETVTEIACWVLLSCVSSVDKGIWDKASLETRVFPFIDKIVRHIVDRQDSSGGFCPLSTTSSPNTRTYSTALAVWALSSVLCNSETAGLLEPTAVRAGVQWLLLHFDSRNGWLPNPNRRCQNRRSHGLHAQVMYVLSEVHKVDVHLGLEPIYKAATEEFLNQDFHVRNVCDNDTLSDGDQWLNDTTFRIEGSTYLWCPWTLATCATFASSAHLNIDSRRSAARHSAHLLDRMLTECVAEAHATYELAELLYCASVLSSVANSTGSPGRRVQQLEASVRNPEVK